MSIVSFLASGAYDIYLAIRARNQELLEADGAGSEEEDAAPARKKKKTSEMRDLSDDEEEMAANLKSIRGVASGSRRQEQNQEDEQEEDQNDDEDAAQPIRGEADENLHAELGDIDVDEVDVDMDMASRDGDLSNEVCPPSICNTNLIFGFLQVGIEEDNSTTSSKARSKSKTPLSKTPIAAATNTSKVVEKHFTPRTLRLALAAKSHVRTRTVYDEPFPRNNKIARINFAWKTIQESAIASDDVEIRQAYKRATKDTAVKSNLMKFVSLSYNLRLRC